MRVGAHTLAALAQAGDAAAQDVLRLVKHLQAAHRTDTGPRDSFALFPCHWWSSDMFAVAANPNTTHLFDCRALNA